MSYTEIFGGETVNPSQLSYIAYESGENLTLVWPMEAPPDSDVAADKIDVTMTVAGLHVTMPAANEVSVGQDVLFRNTGANTFTIQDFDGTEIGSVASGEAWYFVVIDNATDAGDWYAIEFGAGTSSATAASLAGAGLRANANKLDQNLLTTQLITDYAVLDADRATVLQGEAGANTWTFPSASVVGNGWFVYVINAGTGALTLTPFAGQTIDGAATKILQPTESLIVFSDGGDLHTLGYGRTIDNSISALNISAAGTGTITLSDIQVAAQVQDYVGTLTGNKIVEYDSGPGYWFVFNNTTGAFSLTLKADSLDTGAVIPQGYFSIVRNNGTNMSIAFTDLGGSVTSITAGAGLSGGVITTAGTIAMLDTAVTPGAYGSTSSTLVISVNSRGQLTSASAPAISIPISQVQTMTSAELANRVSDETGTGALVFATGPTMTLTNATGLPVATGISGLGVGVANFLATPSSANLATAVTDETGTGALVFANTPTMVGPIMSNPVVGTQTQANNSTLGASTGYVDRVAVQQAVEQQTGAVLTGTTVIPYDDTIPQITEGDEFFIRSITPKSATSKLRIEVTCFVSFAAGTGNMIVALFQDATATALASANVFVAFQSVMYEVKFSWNMTSGTTSATTFRVRGGSDTLGITVTLNGVTGSRVLGGSLASGISITEIGI